MENAEEVMQLLEEFSKTKPKDIPRELEDYLCYVAKTGNPLYQWPLVKTLFREKLISVITDFYENTPTLELPPCPNVEPFNYERVKTSLIERFDLFSSAPFTVQRICELLTSPRKEYNRADKYMRAIEKNIMVVSTREPGTGKRPYECDSQSETVLNGMPDVKINEADGSLLHLPTDLPYLGAPPASNDVTIETSEPNLEVEANTLVVESEIKVDLNHLELNCETKELPLQTGTEQSWQESQLPLEPADRSELNDIKLESDISVGRPIDENDCDTSNGPGLILSSIENSEENAKFEVESKCSSDVRPVSPKDIIVSDLPDSIGSSDSSTTCSEDTIQLVLPKSIIKLESEELESSDENEVSSTPADDKAIGQEKINDPTNSEAEATGTGSNFSQDTEPVVSTMQENAFSRIVPSDNTKSSTISEITANKSDDIELECNEISGTVESPVDSPENEAAQTEELLKENILEASEEAEQCLDPDSSDDVSLENKISPEELSKSEQCSEADSMSDSDLQQSETRSDTEDAPDQTNQPLSGEVTNEPLSGEVTNEPSSHDNLVLDEDSNEVCTSKTSDDDVNAASKSSDSSSNSEDGTRDETVEVNLTEVQSSTEAEAACEEEVKLFKPVTMQSASSSTPDSQVEVGVEQINVDPTCEVEEAMDVDDGSNQMMVSECENESEPMDQSDQQS